MNVLIFNPALTLILRTEGPDSLIFFSVFNTCKLRFDIAYIISNDVVEVSSCMNKLFQLIAKNMYLWLSVSKRSVLIIKLKVSFFNSHPSVLQRTATLSFQLAYW